MMPRSSLRLLPLLGLLFPLIASSAVETNPPAPGFHLAASDPAAIAVADEVMAALGGRKAWDDTRYITWRFFGGRRHVWDKFESRLRFEDKETIVLMNLDTEEGQVWQAGVEITDPTEVTQALNQAKGAWINDSYWLVMPYKLKDSGVTLTYVGQQPDSNGTLCDVLQMTFADVGRTPDNKYHVFVDAETHLVTEWTYWKDASVDDPRSLGPWQNWERHGDILLTADHGQRQHSEIAVFDTLPETVFTEPTPFVLADYLTPASTAQATK